jgi:hypothetical protein
MIVANADLIQEALDKSLEVREEAGIPFGVPLNVYDLCERLTPKVRVRFADYSMEGCYFRSDRPLIEVSALRPIGRRAFNTAHELGHHAFGHGSRIDELQDEDRPESQDDPEEVLANAFARSLLMPRIGLRRAFTSRGWSIRNPTAGKIVFATSSTNCSPTSSRHASRACRRSAFSTGLPSGPAVMLTMNGANLRS